MPTTNLISQSLGSNLLQNGNGTPNHAGNIGNIYFDSTSGSIYKYSQDYSGTTPSSSATWNRVANTTSVSISSTITSSISTSATASWYSLSGSAYGWVVNEVNGFSVNEGRITYTGTSGTFFLNSTTTLKYGANLTVFRAGLAYNVSNPVDGFYASGSLWAATSLYTTINFFGILPLVSGDTVELAINAPLVASTTVNLSGASINIIRVL